MININLMPRYGIYLLGLVAALALGAWLCRRSAGKDAIDRLLCLLCPGLACAVMTFIVYNVLQTPFNDWNADRLAPTISLLKGYKLYYGPGRGPVLNTIYTPLSSVVYLPAGLASSPTVAIWIGTSISLFLFFLPILLLCLSVQGEGEGKKHRNPVLGTFLFLCVCQLALRGGLLVAFSIQADSPAIGFAGLACLIVYRRRDVPDPPIRTWLLAALFANLSVWSKQTLAPIVFVLPFWAFLAHGPRAAARCAGAMAVVLAASAFILRQIFGKASFLFNTFWLPKLHPWNYAPPNTFKGLLLLLVEVGIYCLPMILLTLLLVYLRRQKSPGRSGESAGATAPRPWRSWIQENPWGLYALTALAMVPTAVLGRIKVGGSFNSYTPPYYFLAAALCALILEWHERNRQRGLGALNTTLKVALLTSFLSPLALVNEQLIWHLNVTNLGFTNPQELAYQYARKHPGQVYYPWNALSTLLAEGQVYHFEYGLVDRHLAGFPVSEAHFQRHLPPRLRQVCFPPNRQSEWTMRYLKEFTRRVEIKELPGWICYERQ